MIDGEEPLGIMPREEALRRAREKGLDLVEISPNAVPPVVKIIDYGKFLYRLHKQEQKNKGHRTETKGVRLTIRTGEHDLEVKVRQAEKFLKDRDRVKVMLMFKGREITHFDLGLGKMKRFAEMLKDVSEVDQEPKKQGRTLIMILKPKG